MSGAADIIRGRLSPAEIDRIAQLAERKLTAGQIAQRLNRHAATVGWWMHKLGHRKVTPRTFAYVRKGVTVRSYSPAEDAEILRMRVDGATGQAIADELTARFGYRRTAHSVLVRLVLLEGDGE